MGALKVSNLCKTYIINKRQNNVLRNVNDKIDTYRYFRKGERIWDLRMKWA